VTKRLYGGRVEIGTPGMIQAPKPEPRNMRYESDYEWAAIKQFLPNKPRGVPRVNDRRVVARPSINNTVDGPIGFSRRSRLHAARRASDREIASRHLPHGSGDVGLHEGAGPVHEVQEGLVIHPRGHRAAAAAGGGAALGMERGPAAKAVTERAARRADRGPRQLSQVADGWGLAVRPLAHAHSTERAAGW
jgi:hypothetical protein